MKKLHLTRPLIINDFFELLFRVEVLSRARLGYYGNLVPKTYPQVISTALVVTSNENHRIKKFIKHCRNIPCRKTRFREGGKYKW